jgi:hypothetical protein
VIASVTQTHAYTKASADKIAETVNSALKSFVSGGTKNVLDGVGALVSEALTAFLGASEASEDRIKMYYVMAEDLSIVRVDLRAWYYSVKASGIKDRIEKASAFVAVKSTVDLSKIKFNTFLNLYSRQLKDSGMDETNLIKALDEAKEIYRKFHDVAGGSPLLSSSVLNVVEAPGFSS